MKSTLRNWVEYSRKEVTTRQKPPLRVLTEVRPMGGIDTSPFKFVSHRMVANIDGNHAGELEDAFMPIFSKFDIDLLKTYNTNNCTSFFKEIVYADETDFALGRRAY